MRISKLIFYQFGLDFFTVVCSTFTWCPVKTCIVPLRQNCILQGGTVCADWRNLILFFFTFCLSAGQTMSRFSSVVSKIASLIFKVFSKCLCLLVSRKGSRRGGWCGWGGGRSSQSSVATASAPQLGRPQGYPPPHHKSHQAKLFNHWDFL